MALVFTAIPGHENDFYHVCGAADILHTDEYDDSVLNERMLEQTYALLTQYPNGLTFLELQETLLDGCKWIREKIDSGKGHTAALTQTQDIWLCMTTRLFDLVVELVAQKCVKMSSYAN